MQEGTEILVGVVRKDEVREVRVRLATWNGCDFVDLRVFALFDGTDGERRPTTKGVAVALPKLPELRAALEAAEREARRLGLLGEPVSQP